MSGVWVSRECGGAWGFSGLHGVTCSRLIAFGDLEPVNLKLGEPESCAEAAGLFGLLRPLRGCFERLFCVVPAGESPQSPQSFWS